MQSSHSFSDPQTRILLYELTSASFALSDALTREDSRDEQIAEACQVLEAFELLERGPTTFNVSRDVREKVRASQALGEGRASWRTRRSAEPEGCSSGT